MVCPPMRALCLVTEVFSSGGGPVLGAAGGGGVSGPTFPRPRPCAFKDCEATAKAISTGTTDCVFMILPCMGNLPCTPGAFQDCRQDVRTPRGSVSRVLLLRRIERHVDGFFLFRNVKDLPEGLVALGDHLDLDFAL